MSSFGVITIPRAARGRTEVDFSSLTSGAAEDVSGLEIELVAYDMDGGVAGRVTLEKDDSSPASPAVQWLATVPTDFPSRALLPAELVFKENGVEVDRMVGWLEVEGYAAALPATPPV